MVKAELLELVKQNSIEDHYNTDKMAEAIRRNVLRLPPYH